MLDLVVERRDFGPMVEVYMQAFYRLQAEGVLDR